MKCTDKEWQHCRVEKMGCPGCYYDEIKVNEFVRTKYGEISKITDIFVRDEEILLGVKNTIIVNEYGEYGVTGAEYQKLLLTDSCSYEELLNTKRPRVILQERWK